MTDMWPFIGLTFRAAPADSMSMIRRQRSSRRSPDQAAKRLRLPFGTPEFINHIVAGSVNEAGRRTLFVLITAWDAAGGGPFTVGLIAAARLGRTLDSVQKLFMGPVFSQLLKALGADQIEFRASLCASALIGLGIMRYAIRSEPIHSMDVETLVDAMAPTLQRYLVGDIS